VNICKQLNSFVTDFSVCENQINFWDVPKKKQKRIYLGGCWISVVFKVDTKDRERERVKSYLFKQIQNYGTEQNGFFLTRCIKRKNNGFYSSIITLYRFYIENKLWTRNFSQAITVKSLMLNETFPNRTRHIGIFIFIFFLM